MVTQSDVARFASENQAITKLLENGKLQFSKTGMEFPANAKYQVLKAYGSGRAYRRAIWARENASYDFAQHEPHIVPHKFRNGDHFLFCTLTKSTIPRRKESVEKHIAGKKFRKRLKEAENAQRGRKPRKSIENQVSEGPPEAQEAGKAKGTESKGLSVRGADVNEERFAMDEEFESMSVDNELSESSGRQDERKAAEEKDKEEGDSVFWTRGPERNRTGALDDGHVEDGSERKTQNKQRIANKPRDKFGGQRQSTPKQDNDQGKARLPGGSGTEGSASPSGKRRRSSKPVKKVRRPRQRRKSNPAQD
eukprot:GFKZ01006607.1.p1 GENE.GFKZ01006607.1~~GFKZ01006607.1.p1  ORF type:complete len:308 (-),score=62.22 GFKZ01006607.1:804-1727(-)